jgi:hypothetical protein
MKKRGLEEEVQILGAKFETVLEFLTQKQAAPVLKQLELIQKRIRPKRHVKNDSSKNQNSGLLKPVEVSAEIAKFAGWEEKELHSRVDVTKVICEYIRKHDLQKPTNKKNILPDNVLKILLNWDEDKESMIIQVVDVLFSTDEDSVTAVIDTPPVRGLQAPNYYNGSELYTSEGSFAAVIKKIKLVSVPAEQQPPLGALPPSAAPTDAKRLLVPDAEKQDPDSIKEEETGTNRRFAPVGAAEGGSRSAAVTEDGNAECRYHIVLDKIQEKIDLSTKLTLKVPLTYPKIQARISAHLAEVVKQKKTKPKKQQVSPPEGVDGLLKPQKEPSVKNKLPKDRKRTRLSQTPASTNGREAPIGGAEGATKEFSKEECEKINSKKTADAVDPKSPPEKAPDSPAAVAPAALH